jgi:predicted nucleic acid-binding protein
VRAVFLDTVGLLAVWDDTDQWHRAADQAFRRLLVNNAPLLTTTYVLAECGNAAARRPYRLDVDELRERLDAVGRLITPTDDDWLAAWAGYRLGGAGQAGIVDQISFAVMRRLGVTQAFTNDRHFQAGGFVNLF